MTQLAVTATEGARIDSALFGGNLIFNRTGSSAISEAYESAIDDLGVTSLRYPGGSVTEYFFDINDPDREIAAHSETGEVKEVVPLSDFMLFSEVNGHDVSLVLPTRHYLSETTDANGHRFANVGEEDLRTFVRDLVSGEYGGATIRTLEIGNEYWHSGWMDAIEYGRVANDMINIIDDELAELADDYPMAANIEIAVQMGVYYQYGKISDDFEGQDPQDVLAYFEETYGYEFGPNVLWGGGQVNFHHIANQMIIDELQQGGSFDKADGVIAHIYSYDTDFSRTFALRQIEQTWQDQGKEFTVHATEWNLKGVTDRLTAGQDYGLNSASEILNLVETFASFDVTSANVWPLIQSTDNALIHEKGGDGISPSGAMFAWLSEALPGKKMLDFNPSEQHKTEADFGDFKVHGFADTDELVLYIATEHKEGSLEVQLDLNQLIEGHETADIQILGVEDGSKPFSNRSDAEIETLDDESYLVDGVLTVPLDPGEIVQVSLGDYVPTDALASVLVEDEVAGPALFFVEDTESENEEEDQSLMDTLGGLEWLSAVLPFLVFFGL